MPTFAYQAKQGPSNVVEGTIQAGSQDEVVARLMQQGLVPMTILIKADDAPETAHPSRRVRVSGKERRLFTRQLTSLLKAKVELVPAMTMLKDQAPSAPLRKLVDALERKMRGGETFSAALADHPGVFSPLFLSAIRAGEAAGKLDDILRRLVTFDDQQEQLESQLRGALAYPMLLLALGLGCLAFFIWGIVPQMRSLFDSLGGQLPWPTQLLINCSQFLSHYWGGIIAGTVAFVVVGRMVLRLPVVVEVIERLMLALPVMRDIVQASYISRFTRTLQLLLHSGLPVFQAIDVAKPTLGSARLERRMGEAHERLKQGETIAESLRASGCFPPLVTHMIGVGESAGTLVDVLDELAGYFERQLNETLRITTALLEPAMIILMGLLVGFCVLAMILPVFQMTQLVQ